MRTLALLEEKFLGLTGYAGLLGGQSEAPAPNSIIRLALCGTPVPSGTDPVCPVRYPCG